MSKASFSTLLFPIALLLVTAASATVVTALADDRKPLATKPTAAPPLHVQNAAASAPRAIAEPSLQHLYLIRSTLLLLDTANTTGNYTVLRDAAGPAFQQRHSAADLAMAFHQIRGTLDLAPVAVRLPRLSQPPAVTAEKHLHLAGVVPGEPAAIAFEMNFEPVAGHWRLSALAVAPLPRPVATRAGRLQ